LPVVTGVRPVGYCQNAFKGLVRSVLVQTRRSTTGGQATACAPRDRHAGVLFCDPDRSSRSPVNTSFRFRGRDQDFPTPPLPILRCGMPQPRRASANRETGHVPSARHRTLRSVSRGHVCRLPIQSSQLLPGSVCRASSSAATPCTRKGLKLAETGHSTATRCAGYRALTWAGASQVRVYQSPEACAGARQLPLRSGRSPLGGWKPSGRPATLPLPLYSTHGLGGVPETPSDMPVGVRHEAQHFVHETRGGVRELARTS
jgi:hypothetical protein